MNSKTTSGPIYKPTRKRLWKRINSDIILRHSYQSGVIEHNLELDPDVIRATDLLEDSEEYRDIITNHDTEHN